MINAQGELKKDVRESIILEEKLWNDEKESHFSNKESMNLQKVHLEEEKRTEESY